MSYREWYEHDYDYSGKQDYEDYLDSQEYYMQEEEEKVKWLESRQCIR